jgi:CheY-like chemotaxis protein
MQAMNSTIAPAQYVILLVEDNDNDAELTKLGFAQNNSNVDLRHVTDGEECLLFLRKAQPYAAAPTPALILLDLHMPRMSGLEVLAALQNDPQLRHIPVVVLTTSDAPSDVQAAYQLRCSSYIVKPVGFDAFASAIDMLCKYWLKFVVLPAAITLPPDPAAQQPRDPRTATVM